MSERWVTLPRSTGYEVSDLGRIRSYRDAQGHSQATPRILSPAIVRGYAKVNLGRNKPFALHRLILEGFVGPCPEGSVCRHLNGDPLDNRLVNLRWGTPEENYDDRRKHGTSNDGERHGRAKLTVKQVQKIKAALCWETATPGDLAAEYGVSLSTINHIRYGRSWRTV